GVLERRTLVRLLRDPRMLHDPFFEGHVPPPIGLAGQSPPGRSIAGYSIRPGPPPSHRKLMSHPGVAAPRCCPRATIRPGRDRAAEFPIGTHLTGGKCDLVLSVSGGM